MEAKKVHYDSILIIDDEIDIANCMKRFLEHYGYHVIAFTNPSLALEEFYNHFDSYNLIISDYNMNAMTGFEFSESAKQRSPSIKILLSSAQDVDNLEFRKQAAAANVDALLQKPYSLCKLIDFIEGKNCAISTPILNWPFELFIDYIVTFVFIIMDNLNLCLL
jgi:CheY-like chemotaxis protein